MKRLLLILAIVALAALAHLWPLETFLGVCALAAVGLALIVGAGLGFGVGKAAAAAELATKEPAVLSETEAHAALVRLMEPLDEGQRRRVIMMACHRYVVEPDEKKIERETLMALFMPGKRAM